MTAKPPAKPKKKDHLHEVVKRLSELKPLLKSLLAEEAELKEQAMNLVRAENCTEVAYAGIGKIQLTKNTPQRRLDKDALKAYLVEQCKVAPSKVDAGFEAATKDGAVNKPWKVEFVPESKPDAE